MPTHAPTTNEPTRAVTSLRASAALGAMGTPAPADSRGVGPALRGIGALLRVCRIRGEEADD